MSTQSLPFYFASANGSLFGIHQPPAARAARDCGVVLCHPIGNEYIRSHRAYRELAARLSRAGFAVLRFDYFGSGDSEGDFEEAGLRLWTEDAVAALAEIRRHARSSKLCAVGLRLGAGLAMEAAAIAGGIDAIVLWDPVLSGRAYIEESVLLHEERLSRYASREAPLDRERPDELLGFPMTTALLDELRALDSCAVRGRPARRGLLLDSGPRSESARLQARLEEIGMPTELQHVAAPRVWCADMNQDKGLVPARALQAIVSWLSKVFP